MLAGKASVGGRPPAACARRWNWGGVGSAEGTVGVGEEPHIYTRDMEGVQTLGKRSEFFPFLELTQTHRAGLVVANADADALSVSVSRDQLYRRLM